jgi:hypothetical protein
VVKRVCGGKFNERAERAERKEKLMELVLISLCGIVISAYIFYFVIKGAVRNGINESMLFSDEQRAERERSEGTPLKKCPQCGKEHDFDYPKCPYCKREHSNGSVGI